MVTTSPDFASRQTLAHLEFHDYVIAEITRCCGPQLPHFRAREVTGGFLERFGPGDAMAVCRQAFGPHGGYWRGAPVTVARFGPGHDSFFALPLLAEARGDDAP